MRAGRGGRLANLALAVGAAIAFSLVLLLAELVYRRLAPAYLEELGVDEARLHTYSARLGWVPRHGYRSTLARADTSVNDRGYRGRLHGPKAAGRTRIVVVGDSVAFGYGVADDATFPAVLERTNGRVEALNLAVQGYGTDQALLRLQDEAPGLQPDVVVASVCLANDFVDNGQCHSSGHPKPCFTAGEGAPRLRTEHLRISPFARLVLFLRGESLLYNRLASLAGRRPPPPAALGDADEDRVLELTRALLESMGDTAGRFGARFLVVLHPGRDDLRPAPPRATRKFRKVMAASPLEQLWLQDVYPARGFDLARFDAYALDLVGHLRPEGHALTARLLEERLCGLGWIPC